MEFACPNCKKIKRVRNSPIIANGILFFCDHCRIYFKVSLSAVLVL